MTLTRSYPLEGRVGPGCLWHYTSDLIGPIVPNTLIVVEIRDTTDHVVRMAMSGKVNNVAMVGFFGCPQNYFNLTIGQNGLPDDDPVELHAYWLVPGSGVVDEITETGFSWDAVSQLYWANLLNMQSSLGGTSGISSAISDIRAAVLHEYSTP